MDLEIRRGPVNRTLGDAPMRRSGTQLAENETGS